MSKVVGLEKAEIFPINSTQSYSFRNGNPLIDFELGASPGKVVDPSSLRLNFNLNCGYGNGTGFRFLNNQSSYGDITDAARGVSTGNINPRVGVSCVVDTVKVSNFQNQVIEEVRQHSRLNSTVIPMLNDFRRYKCALSNVYGAYGNCVSQMLRVNSEMECSIPLRAGLLQSRTPLNPTSLGGLKIQISLSPDSAIFNTTDADNLVPDAANEGTGQVYYQLSDVSISFNYLVMDKPSQPMNGIIPYAAYRSFLNIVHSSDNQSTLNLALSSVRTAFQTYLQSSSVNNYEEDSLKTHAMEDISDTAIQIKEVAFLRAGVKFPSQFSTNERKVLDTRASAFPAHMLRDYMNSVRKYKAIKSTLMSPVVQSTRTRIDNNYDQPDGGAPQVQGPDELDSVCGGYSMYGIGVRFDQLNIGQGSDFSQRGFTVRLVSDLTDGTPQSCFTFALSNQGLAVKNMSVSPIA